jgi:hypothetical protein
MRFVSAPRCPSDQCLRSFARDGPISLLAVLAQSTPRAEWPEWFEEIICYKSSKPEHLVDPVYECPDCHLVWIQPSNFDPGFHAMPRGYHRSNPDRLDPVPPSVHMRDPGGRMVADGRGKRRDNRR